MTTTAEPKIQRLDRLTSLRFFAALLVVLHHATRDLGTIPHVTDFLSGGVVGVSFFFVLSGFILTWTSRPGTASSFYRRRFARVYPLHLLMWIVAIPVLLGIGQEIGTVEAVACLLLLQAWIPSPPVYFGVNAPSWSLSCEAFFYALFPFLPLHRVRRWHLAVLTIAPLAGALVVTGLIGYSRWVVYIAPPFRVLEFLAGVALAVAIRDGWRPRVPFPLAAATAIAAIFVALGPLSPVLGENHGLYDGLLLPAWLLLIASAASADIDRARGWMTAHPMIKLGEWSFALYITHWVVLEGVADVVDLGGEPVVVRVLADLLFVVVAVGISAAAYRFYEMPLERRLRTPRARRAVALQG